jgi:esterase/lipase superfamily enzyme
MIRRTLVVALFLIGFASAAVGQQAANLIDLTARTIGTGSSEFFDESVRSWIAGAGKAEIAKLQAVGQINEVIGGNDYVAPPLWFGVGRAVHSDGFSDWQIVFSSESGKIVRVSLKVTLMGEPLPAPPTLAARGLDAPSVLGPCKAISELCGNSAATADPRIVEFLFATTRLKAEDQQRVSFSGERNNSLSFGAARVRVPEDHRFGKLELPTSVRFLGISLYEAKSDSDRHFAIKEVRSLSRAQWDDVVRDKGSDNALIFVHGFNTSFDEALYRTAQIVWDLQYPGIAVLFSWASRGGVLNYPYDQQSALNARDQFVELLKVLKIAHGIQRVHVLAHSMGNYLVIDALAELARRSDPVKIGELLMAAPDVDRDQFAASVPIVRQIADGMTLYASSADKAMIASRKIAGVPRAGDIPTEGPVVASGMETIDVTALGEDVLGLNHDVFASVRSVMNDIGIVITSNPRKAPHLRLFEVRRVPEMSEFPKYWRYSR